MADLSAATAELASWFERWAECVRQRNYDGARSLFDLDVVGFGTRMHVVSGLDRLEQLQWRQVWPTIEGFRFLVDEIHVGVSSAGDLAWAVVPWVSIGFHEDGRQFDRPGRATVTFSRTGDPQFAPGGWIALHTHISLAPGTPQRSFGPKGSPSVP